MKKMCVLFCLACLLFLLSSCTTELTEEEIADFQQYKSYLIMLNDVVLSDYKEQNTEERFLYMLDFEKGTLERYDETGNANDERVSIIIEDEIVLAIKELTPYLNERENFFDCIYVYENQIVYCMIHGKRTIIYTENGKKPRYYFSPDEKTSFKVRKLQDNWYSAYLPLL